MNIGECFHLGYVIKKHGLNGEVNVLLDVDFPDQYQNMESVFVEINDKLVPFFIDRISVKGNKAVVKFEDVDSADDADDLKGFKLYLPVTLLPKLNDDKFYYHEIIGFRVMDEVLGDVGEVKDVYTSVKQDLLAVDHQGREVLIPVNDGIVKGVNRELGHLLVTMPEGLLDIYLD